MTKIGLGGGCHWCTEAIFQSLVGVNKVEQGWTGSIEDPNLSEAVIVHFDSNYISLKVLIEVHMNTHSATSSHTMREKYRSAIYVYNEEQFEEANVILQKLQIDFEDPLITRVLMFSNFILNSEKYLDYYYKNPEKAFCKNIIDSKLKVLISKFSKNIDREKLKL